jgi:hypothetical protein
LLDLFERRIDIPLCYLYFFILDLLLQEFVLDQRLKLRPGEKGWRGMLAETRKILMEVLQNVSI